MFRVMLASASAVRMGFLRLAAMSMLGWRRLVRN